jgi:hypothetical protein
MKPLSHDQLTDILYECKPENSWDGRSRLTDDSSKIPKGDGTWGVVSDHGNVEFYYRGNNGRLYYVGGMV